MSVEGQMETTETAKRLGIRNAPIEMKWARFFFGCWALWAETAYATSTGSG